MNHPHHPQGEMRPPVTPDPCPDDYVVPVPLLRLRGHDRRAIPPNECMVSHCPVLFPPH